MTWSDQIRAVLNATYRTNRDAHATPGAGPIKTGARCSSSSIRSFTLGAFQPGSFGTTATFSAMVMGGNKDRFHAGNHCARRL
jgi:hypothetical protein